MKSLDLTNVSVYVDKSVHPTYEALVSRSSKNAESRPFATMKDLFLISACVGARHNRFEELGSSRDIFSGEIFNTKTEVPILAALAFFRTKDIEVLSDPRAIVDIAQGWANGGIQIVCETLLEQPGAPLFNLVDWVISELTLE